MTPREAIHRAFEDYWKLVGIPSDRVDGDELDERLVDCLEKAFQRLQTPSEPEPTAPTIRCRIALAIAPTRDWDCRGWGFPDGNETDDALKESLLDGSSVTQESGFVLRWAEVGVQVPPPVPAMPTEVLKAELVEGVANKEKPGDIVANP